MISNPAATISFSRRMIILATISLLAFHCQASEQRVAKHKPRLSVEEQVETFIDRTNGYTIDLPHSFRLTSEHSGLLFFQTVEMPGTLIIKPTPGMGLHNVQVALRQGFQTDHIILKPTGAPISLNVNGGQGMALEVTGSIQGREVRGMLAGVFGGNQQGYMMLIGSVKERWQALLPSAQPILESLSIIPIEPGYDFERWQQRLIGSQLNYAEFYGGAFRGGAISSSIMLCEDGRFLQNTGNSSYYSDAWVKSYTYSGKNQHGKWDVRGVDQLSYLNFRSSKGGVNTADLTERDGYIFLNGQPYVLVPKQQCRLDPS